MAEMVAFKGDKVREWIKATQPKGMDLVAIIEHPLITDSEGVETVAVFRSAKNLSRIRVFRQRSAVDGPFEAPNPHEFFRWVLERSGAKAKLFIKGEDVLLLVNDAIIEKEKNAAKEGLPKALCTIQKKIQTIMDRSEVDKISDIEEMKDALYSLNSIASDCATMALNLSLDLLEKMEARPIRAEA